MADYSSQPTVNYVPANPAVDTSSQPHVINMPNSPPAMTVAEVKALVKGGLGEDVILSKIRTSHAVFHLTTAEILDLKQSGVSEKVIDFMINTASQR